MTHLEVENLASDYLEGRLAASHRALVEEHLAVCGQCGETLDNVRWVIELASSAEDLEPAPWLIPRIMLATVGERKPTFGELVAAYFRPVVRTRAAYVLAMAVFSLSVIVNAAGINLRQIKLQDLNPRNWAYQANRTGHLLFGRAEKYYYDLRVVYEVESRLRQLRRQSGDEEKPKPKPQAPPGGSTDGTQVGNLQLASLTGRRVASAAALRGSSFWGQVIPVWFAEEGARAK